jgi:hypothetical protein
MPVCFVKLSAVNFCRSTICGLLTIRTEIALLPPPPPDLLEIRPALVQLARWELGCDNFRLREKCFRSRDKPSPPKQKERAPRPILLPLTAQKMTINYQLQRSVFLKLFFAGFPPTKFQIHYRNTVLLISHQQINDAADLSSDDMSYRVALDSPDKSSDYPTHWRITVQAGAGLRHVRQLPVAAGVSLAGPRSSAALIARNHRITRQALASFPLASPWAGSGAAPASSRSSLQKSG